ncbi:MAG: NAD(+)/NADH kinase, partial [Candidatus Aerophobus sp.]
MSKTMGIIVNREKEGAVQYARGVIQWLEKKGNRVLVTNWLGNRIHRHDLVADKNEMGEISDLVISLGGDGTLCRAARDCAPYEVPLLGINFGGLGFLTEIPISRYRQGLNKILADDYRTEKRLMLEANLIRNKKKIETCLALN